MRIISRKALREFWKRHPDSEHALQAWYREVVGADWSAPANLIARYPSASFVGNNRVVFNIKGNSHRLVAEINYRERLVYIRFIGTHAEYDRIDAKTV